MVKKSEPTEKARRWAEKLSYHNRLTVRELIFRLYAISEDLRFERKENKKK